MQESLQESLKQLLEIQEKDMKMIRLMRVKKDRINELDQINSLRKELHQQVSDKETEIGELGKTITTLEQKVQEVTAKVKRLESQQNNIKKVDEYNALTQEITASEREKTATEQKLSDLVDKRVAEEEILAKIKESLTNSEASSLALQHEIESSVRIINQEGSTLKSEREALAKAADEELLRIYERLLRNKKDRVIVPIENRTCSGCHIVLTAQHENVVRKGDNLVFCEHCSRIHYWQEIEAVEGAGATTKRRRRRAAST